MGAEREWDELWRDAGGTVERLLVCYGWGLLEREAFVLLTIQAYMAGSAKTLWGAAMGVYAETLHGACVGADRDRQARAYTELFRYLLAAAAKVSATHSEELAQAALVRVYLTISNCRKAAAFLIFAADALRNEARPFYREASRWVALPPDQTEAGIGEAGGGAEMRGGDPAQELSQRAAYERLEGLIQAFRVRYPKRTHQLDALLLKHLAGVEDATIGVILGEANPDKIYQWRSRIAKKLAKDPAWRALAEELGIRLGNSKDK